MLQNTAAFTALTCFYPYFSSCLHRMAWFTNSLSMTVLNEWFTNVEFLTQLIWDCCNKYNHWSIGLWPLELRWCLLGALFPFLAFLLYLLSGLVFFLSKNVTATAIRPLVEFVSNYLNIFRILAEERRFLSKISGYTVPVIGQLMWLHSPIPLVEKQPKA